MLGQHNSVKWFVWKVLGTKCMLNYYKNIMHVRTFLYSPNYKVSWFQALLCNRFFVQAVRLINELWLLSIGQSLVAMKNLISMFVSCEKNYMGWIAMGGWGHLSFLGSFKLFYKVLNCFSLSICWKHRIKWPYSSLSKFLLIRPHGDKIFCILQRTTSTKKHAVFVIC